MANEYLQRTPTSTGNRKVFTWSGWVKSNIDNAPANGNAIFMCAAENDGNLYYRTRLGRYVVNEGDFGFNHYDGANDNYGTQALNRDHSNWEHYICAVDTTQEQTTDRVKLYLNGVYQSDLTTVVAIDKDLDTFMNGNSIHFVGADSWTATPNSYSKLLMSDVFFVDGQALTPDVFGFYKDGDGYISAGSTQATDFRPGQWVPKRPRIIKTEIERRGGFGVNGFYLPMNDSSNSGADFHCDPNSIITLKGEDLPQPRNGAPTTTDAYVSQLRSDANAANLVLAVPGISTATGANLVSNGTFDTDVSGWGVSGGTFTWNNGRAQHVTTSNFSIYQQITGLTIGQRYTFQYTHYSGYTAAYISTNTVSSGSILALGDTSTSSETTKRGSFTATATSHYVVIYGIGSNTSIWDDVIVKQEDAPRDYSADIKGSGSNKTLTPNGGAGVGYELGGYYGSAMSFDGNGDYLTHASNSDFAFGTDDFTVECWANFDDLSASLSDIITSGTQTGGFGLYCSGAVLSFVSQSNEAVSGIALTTGQWNHLAVERYGSTLTIYTNGVAVSVDTTFAHTMTQNGVAIGAQVGGANPIDGVLQDLRVYKGVAKYKGGFDVPKPYTPVGIESWRTVADCTANNFATLNQLASRNILSNGNLTAAFDNSVNYNATISNFMVNSGKWYCEVRFDEESSGNVIVGVHNLKDMKFIYGGSYFFGGEGGSNDFTVNNGVRVSPVASDGDIIRMKLDLDSSPAVFSYAVNNGAFTDYESGVFSSQNHLKVGETYGFVAADAQSGVTGIQATFNFGQNPSFSGQTTAGTNTDSNGKGLFKYAPPSGFLALCEDNLPAPAVADPGEHFKTVLYSGDGVDGRSVTGVGFQPDMVWIKERDGVSGHYLLDSVRGATNYIRPNVSNAEDSNDNTVKSFDSNGFTTGDSGAFNDNTNNYVAWCWKAGGAAVANNDGDRASQVSANQDAGFSIVTYDGGSAPTTVGHGLGKTPKMIVVKNRDTTDNWPVYHSSIGPTQYLWFNTDHAVSTNSGVWNDTDPASSVFTVGNFGHVNTTSETYVAYCWAEMEGYSKFGSYIGNGSTDGAFVYCGFKPAFVMLKASSTTGNWCMIDNARNSTNPTNFFTVINAASSNGDDTGGALDFLSNGFKLRLASANFNGTDVSYIFAAFAESPFKTSNAK